MVVLSFVSPVHDLGATSEMLMNAALKQNKKRTYSSAQSRFIKFCDMYKQVVMPVTEDTLLLYVSYLFEEGLVGSSIRVYLSAVRSLHVFAGKPYPTDINRLKLALKEPYDKLRHQFGNYLSHIKCS